MAARAAAEYGGGIDSMAARAAAKLGGIDWVWAVHLLCLEHLWLNYFLEGRKSLPHCHQENHKVPGTSGLSFPGLHNS